MQAIQEKLVALGFTVSIVKPYEMTTKSVPTTNGADTNGHTNGHDQSRAGVVREAGGNFTYLTRSSDLPVPVSELAAIALEKYDLKFAYGDMFQVEGDELSADRARSDYGNGMRLCWSWHNEPEIVDGIERLATLTKDIKQSKLIM